MTGARPPERTRRQPRGSAGPTNPIDPRLRARRAEVARERGTRRHRLLFLTVLVLSALLGAWLIAYRSPVLDVDQVTVRGNVRTPTAAVRRATGVSTGTPLVGVDLGAVRRGVEGQPWVRRATVERRWPGTLQVTVIERAPVAVVGRGRAAVLVDEHGQVLGPAPADPGLPRLAARSAPVGDRLGFASRGLAEVVAQLPAAVRRQVLTAEVSAERVTFTLTDGVKVRWGDTTATTDKARSLLLLLAKADRATIASVDVSVPSAAALTRKDGPVA